MQKPGVDRAMPYLGACEVRADILALLRLVEGVEIGTGLSLGRTELYPILAARPISVL